MALTWRIAVGTFFSSMQRASAKSIPHGWGLETVVHLVELLRRLRCAAAGGVRYRVGGSDQSGFL